ncbi:MAG: hypothetical protein AAF465_04220 [Pseudomonadota bacterium]
MVAFLLLASYFGWVAMDRYQSNQETMPLPLMSNESGMKENELETTLRLEVVFISAVAIVYSVFALALWLRAPIRPARRDRRRALETADCVNDKNDKQN